MLLLPQLLLSSASADLSAAQPTLSLPLVRRRRHHPRVTHAARRLSQAAPLPTTEAGPFFGSVSDDYVAPVTLGVGRGAQTFLLVADTGSSAVAVVGDPNLGCLRYLDTSDRCDTNRHVECLYGSGGWRGVDCHREVALGGLAVRGYELAAVTWEQAFLMCPASPDEGQGAPLRPDMLIEGIFGLSLSGLRGSTNTSVPLLHALFAAHPRLRRAFGLQCCPFLVGSGKGGDGALDIGGADPAHFRDEGGRGFAYAAVVAQELGYWGVDLLAVRLEGSPASLLRDDAQGEGSSTATDAFGRAKYIVDSGTSLLLLRPPAFAALKAALLDAAGPKAPKAHHGFWKVRATPYPLLTLGLHSTMYLHHELRVTSDRLLGGGAAPTDF